MYKRQAYALSKEKLNILDNYFINSFLRTIRGRYIDFNTEGRGISRPNILDKFGVAGKKNTASIIDMAKQVNPANIALLDTAALRLTEKMPAGYGIQPSHTHFWKGDYSIHLRKQFSFNVRTVSTRTKPVSYTHRDVYKRQQLRIAGGAATAADNEDWVISKLLYLNTVQPDVAVAIKNVTQKINSFDYVYTKP